VRYTNLGSSSGLEEYADTADQAGGTSQGRVPRPHGHARG
jgi:hypothetical protein